MLLPSSDFFLTHRTQVEHREHMSSKGNLQLYHLIKNETPAEIPTAEYFCLNPASSLTIEFKFI